MLWRNSCVAPGTVLQQLGDAEVMCGHRAGGGGVAALGGLCGVRIPKT